MQPSWSGAKSQPFLSNLLCPVMEISNKVSNSPRSWIPMTFSRPFRLRTIKVRQGHGQLRHSKVYISSLFKREWSILWYFRSELRVLAAKVAVHVRLFMLVCFVGCYRKIASLSESIRPTESAQLRVGFDRAVIAVTLYRLVREAISNLFCTIPGTGKPQKSFDPENHPLWVLSQSLIMYLFQIGSAEEYAFGTGP